MTKELIRVDRPWGHYVTVYSTPLQWVKIITVNPGESLSLQVHEHRDEFWTVENFGLRAEIDDQTLDLLPEVRYDVPRGIKHRVWNTLERTAVSFVEVADGMPMENDIIRLEDRYGR